MCIPINCQISEMAIPLVRRLPCIIRTIRSHLVRHPSFSSVPSTAPLTTKQALYILKSSHHLSTMQSFAIRQSVRSISRAATIAPRSSPQVARISTTALLRDESKPDAAGDSLKRGAQNVSLIPYCLPGCLHVLVPSRVGEASVRDGSTVPGLIGYRHRRRVSLADVLPSLYTPTFTSSYPPYSPLHRSLPFHRCPISTPRILTIDDH